MITFLTGKPGDGKSMYGTLLILNCLVEGEAFVVTNIPLKAPDVCAYVAKIRRQKNDDRSFSFDDSVRVLKDEEVYEFYRRRSGGLVLNASPDFECEPRDRMDRPAFVAAMKVEFMRIKQNPDWMLPVWYFIDEAHNYFSAREWASAGRGMLYYSSQHRHLHDQIFFITQVVDNVEKQLRGLASELHRIRNHMRRSMGPFKLRPCFKVHKFYGVPSDQAPGSPYDVNTLYLDPSGVAGCYHTVGALGVQSKPEKVTNAGRLPWWSIWLVGCAGVAVIALGFIVVPAMAGKTASKLLTSSVDSALVGKVPGLNQIAAANSPNLNNDTLRSQNFTNSPSGPSPRFAQGESSPVSLIRVTGWVIFGSKINILLTDGRTLTEESGLAKVERNRVIMDDGTIYWRGSVAPTASISALPAVGSRSGLLGEKASPEGAPTTPTVSSSQASESGSWITGSDGVTRLRNVETLRR